MKDFTIIHCTMSLSPSVNKLSNPLAGYTDLNHTDAANPFAEAFMADSEDFDERETFRPLVRVILDEESNEEFDEEFIDGSEESEEVKEAGQAVLVDLVDEVSCFTFWPDTT